MARPPLRQYSTAPPSALSPPSSAGAGAKDTLEFDGGGRDDFPALQGLAERGGRGRQRTRALVPLSAREDSLERDFVDLSNGSGRCGGTRGRAASAQPCEERRRWSRPASRVRGRSACEARRSRMRAAPTRGRPLLSTATSSLSSFSSSRSSSGPRPAASPSRAPPPRPSTLRLSFLAARSSTQPTPSSPLSPFAPAPVPSFPSSPSPLDEDLLFSSAFSPEALTLAHTAQYGAGGGGGRRKSRSKSASRAARGMSYDVPEEGEAWDVFLASAGVQPGEGEGGKNSRMSGAEEEKVGRMGTARMGTAALRRLRAVAEQMGWAG